MRVAIIGEGFTGLSAGYYLSKAGVDVTIYESAEFPGGLAGGFSEKNWEWPLEEHYHHFFASDTIAVSLAKEVSQKIDFKTPKSSTYLDGDIFQLDSPLSLLTFKKLSFVDRLRTGAVIAFLKIDPLWEPLEKVTSYDFITKAMGIYSWNIIWRPLFEKKFGKYAKEINAAWFWARIKKRSASLGYPEGGFLSFAEKIEKEIINNGGKVLYNTQITSVKSRFIKPFNNLTISKPLPREITDGIQKIILKTKTKEYIFDKVICTLPSNSFLQISEDLPRDYINELSRLKGLGTINLVLSLKNEFLKDGSYWLNINEMSFPFLALVEHTNFVDKKYYNGEYLLYIVNYLPADHEYFSYTDKQLLDVYLAYLNKINKDFSQKQINRVRVFKSSFSQPIVGKNHSKIIPAIETPLKNLYLANIQQVYPWDRGVNYAVELGKKAADLVLKSKET